METLTDRLMTKCHHVITLVISRSDCRWQQTTNMILLCDDLIPEGGSLVRRTKLLLKVTLVQSQGWSQGEKYWKKDTEVLRIVVIDVFGFLLIDMPDLYLSR